MNVSEKIARHRLSVLQLAETLDSASEACRQLGVTRTQFFEYRKRFQRTVLEEFFIETLRTIFYETAGALQTDFDAWLHYYNAERPHQGYRTLGR